MGAKATTEESCGIDDCGGQESSVSPAVDGEGTGAGDDDDKVLVAVVESRGAKGVKDVLKARGWLSESHKPGNRGAGCIAFPVVPGAADELRGAVAASGPDGSLAAVVSLELVPASEMSVKKHPPPQKATAAPRTGRAKGAQPRSHQKGRAGGSKAAGATQERSFGGGARCRALRGLLPEAPQIRCVDCSGHGSDAAWLWDNVFGRREPAVLRGLDMGPCMGAWTPERLAAAACRAPAVSVHVCPSPTVDLAGHRRPNTPRNFEFRTMPFREAVARCATPSTNPVDSGASGLAVSNGVSPETPCQGRVAASAATGKGAIGAGGIAAGGGGEAAVQETGGGIAAGGDAVAAAAGGAGGGGQEAAGGKKVGASAEGAAEGAAEETTGESAAAAAGGGGGASKLPSYAPLLAPGERYYLRSVGLNPRADAADMPSLFPELARECQLLPAQRPRGRSGGFWLHEGSYHSSVLRLASDDTQLWTHFDVMDNVLAQVTGRKRVVMWPPSEDERLYVEGSSSRVADIDRFNDDEFPMFRASLPSRAECELQPGEALFIPALWFHNTTSIGFSVGVNVFWRSHKERQQRQLYDKKDLYGNRDPPAATAAIGLALEAAEELRCLPQPFRDFYARRALRALQGALMPDDEEEEEAEGGGRGGGAAAAGGGAVGGGGGSGGAAAAAGGGAAAAAAGGGGEAGGGSGAAAARVGEGGTARPAAAAAAAAAAPRLTKEDNEEEQCPGGARVTLQSGARMPLLGLGTWELPRESARGAVEAALRCGMRHIDCASIYGNQGEVGAALGGALSSGAVRRRDLFVTSKAWNSDHRRVREACLKSLRALQLDRLDLYLLHWPPNDDASLLGAWRQMEALVEEGLVTSVGVCNLSARKLGLLLEDPQLRVPPAVNQVEAHPGWRNQGLLDFCTSRGVHVTAYSPLGRGIAQQQEGTSAAQPSSSAAAAAAAAAAPLLSSPGVVKAAEALGCTPAQALLKWALRRGTSAVFKSASPERISSNFEARRMILHQGSGSPASRGDCDDSARDDDAAAGPWDLMLGVPQERRVKGLAFVVPAGRGAAVKAGQVAFQSLSELWDEYGG